MTLREFILNESCCNTKKFAAKDFEEAEVEEKETEDDGKF